MNLKTLLSKSIRKFRHDIIRIRNYRIKHRHIKGKPLKIEFLGPSGVGKTTLYKELLQKRNRKDKWISIKEFLRSCSNRSINNIACDKSYGRLLEYKIKSVHENKNNNILIKLGLLSFFSQNLKNDILVSKFNNDYKVVWDDGIFHNFGKEVVALANEDERSISEFINNLAVVYCYASEDFITKNILKRQQENGQTRPQHYGLESNQLNIVNQQSLKNMQEMISFLKKYNVPVLEVNMAAASNENIKNIKIFIHNL